MNRIILFGVRSPLLPDYEECCSRLGLEIAAAINVVDLRPRMLDRSTVIDVSNLIDAQRSLPFVACAFNPHRRLELVELAASVGLCEPATLIEPSANIAKSTRIGCGTFINMGVAIGAAGLVGDHVFINRASSIGHHCLLGDFVSVGPGVTIAGNVHIGHRGFVGAGSIVLPGIRIGDAAIVAAGSLVKRDVPSGSLVAGNPATVIRDKANYRALGAEGEE